MFLYLLEECLAGYIFAGSLCPSPVSGEIVLGVVVRAVILCYCMGESVMAMPILS